MERLFRLGGFYFSAEDAVGVFSATVKVCIYINVDDYRDIYSPVSVGLSSLANEVIVLPLAFIASLLIHMN